MRHSTILTALAAITTLAMVLPATGKGRVQGPTLDEALADELDAWLADCGHLLAGEKNDEACSFERVEALEDLPLSKDELAGVYALLDAEPVTPDTGVVRALGVADTIPYDFWATASQAELLWLPEFEWPSDVEGVLFVFAEVDGGITDPDSLFVIQVAGLD